MFDNTGIVNIDFLSRDPYIPGEVERPPVAGNTERVQESCQVRP